MIRKFLCLFVIALMIFAVSGCGGSSSSNFVSDNDTQNQNNTTSQDNTPQEDTTTQDNSQNEDTTTDNTPSGGTTTDNTPPVIPHDGWPSDDITPPDIPASNPVSNDEGGTSDNNPVSDDTASEPETDDSVQDIASEDVATDTQSEDVSSGESYEATGSGEHAISLTDGTAAIFRNITVTKTGDASGRSDDYDWKGTNAAILASGGSNLTIEGSGTRITTSATYGNAVFSYGGNNSNSSNNQGDGTTVNISDATIITTSNNSGGIMTTGGGIMNASNLTITTSGGSSAAIRSDSGGGTVTVNGGTYTTSGRGSPAIYSTAAITVADADLTSNTAQVVVIEGGNSVTLDNAVLTANHNTKNGQDTTYQAVLIYKSMSKDASSGKSYFKMTDGSLTNSNGDIFCVTNTTTEITLSGVNITNNDSSGNFLRAEGQEWGTSGSNGGTVTLNASGQDIAGNIIVDSSSSLALNMTDSSTFKGAVNSSGSGGTVDVTIQEGSTWTLTGNSYITSLTNNGTINKGSYTLYVNGTAQ